MLSSRVLLRKLRFPRSSRDAISRSRFFSTLEDDVERESMPFDVLIVGGGPAGLAASIRLKQLCSQHDTDLSVCVVEKGSEIGSHILSGNVFDPKALEELLPDDDDWKSSLQESTNSIATAVSSDKFSILTEDGSYTIPNALLPPQLHNDGNYVISLGQLCRWMGGKAEEMEVEIYPGFAAADVVWGEDGVKGVTTRDAGIGKDNKPKETFEPGMHLLARQTLFAEGARGSLTQSVLSKFDLGASSHPQTYGLGIKEVWEIPPDKFKSGVVQHTLGWPLQSSLIDKTFGGTFLYYQEPNLLHCGMVVGLDYENPYINPYKEFQRWKTHPDIKDNFEGGECIGYGARVLNEGGWHALPKLTFKGGMLLGCAAGFLNAVKIKGSHCAIKSGIEAAESVFDVLTKEEVEAVADCDEILNEDRAEVVDYEKRIKESWVGKELYEVRNTHAAFQKWGLVPGLLYSGLTAHVLKGREPWTLSHDRTDSGMTGAADTFEEIKYPAPDNILTFDLLTNLQRSGTYHDDDQPSHLKIKGDLDHVPKDISMQVYAAPEQRFCPAGVYEYHGEEDKKELVINAQNCIHCKCCSIKMPYEYIKWDVPEGGGGPQYQVM